MYSWILCYLSNIKNTSYIILIQYCNNTPFSIKYLLTTLYRSCKLNIIYLPLLQGYPVHLGLPEFLVLPRKKVIIVSRLILFFFKDSSRTQIHFSRTSNCTKFKPFHSRYFKINSPYCIVYIHVL